MGIPVAAQGFDGFEMRDVKPPRRCCVKRSVILIKDFLDPRESQLLMVIVVHMMLLSAKRLQNYGKSWKITILDGKTHKISTGPFIQ